jgi:uncharacterized protein
MEINQITTISQVERKSWNMLAGEGYPFMRHEFLSALEESGCASDKTGWRPSHLIVFEDKKLIAGMPLYLKSHSRGEFVFDHQWVYAYEQYGRDYFPKWLTAIPFTPCQGLRIAVKEKARQEQVINLMFDFVKAISEQNNISSWHCLFPAGEQVAILKKLGLLVREGVQFQWFNKGYVTFDDFLSTFSASKRKMLKRERRKVAEQGIEMIQLSGSALTEHQWRVFYDFYQMTYYKHGMPPYLNLEFFLLCAASMGDKIVVVFALKEGVYVGASLSFIGNDTLYGRYWGCREEFNALHFEACYYQGVDYCIENRLQRFDSGAQGEHKIARGFEPITTNSVHWFQDDRFAKAIEQFLIREKTAVQYYREEATGYLPFKK